MKKVLVFGGAGLVGSKFIELFNKDLEIKSPSVSEVDILNKDHVAKVTREFNPDTIINFAAFTNVEVAEDQSGDKEGICYQINSIGARNVAEACKEFGKHLIHISTEYVFDGTKSENPYTEEDEPNPLNWYGQTKYFAEEFVLASRCLSTIVRICMPFSAFYEVKSDIGRFFLGQLKSGLEVKAIEDQKITPTLVNDIANALKILVDTRKLGIYHVCSTNSTTPFEFAKNIALTFNLDVSPVKPISFDEYNKNKKAKLLKYSWLNPGKFTREFANNNLHTIEENVGLFKQDVDAKTDN